MEVAFEVEMLINFYEPQVFANPPKFISCFLCCHTCFKVWAGVIVHYSMPIFIQIFLLEIIFQISLDGPQYSDGLRFPTQSPYNWPNLGLEWSICSKSRVASSCLPEMMNIHSSIRNEIGVIWQNSDLWAKNWNLGPKKRKSFLYSNHVLATSGKSCP